MANLQNTITSLQMVMKVNDDLTCDLQSTITSLHKSMIEKNKSTCNQQEIITNLQKTIDEKDDFIYQSIVVNNNNDCITKLQRDNIDLQNKVHELEAKLGTSSLIEEHGENNIVITSEDEVENMYSDEQAKEFMN